jgi:hypothetical protein
MRAFSDLLNPWSRAMSNALKNPVPPADNSPRALRPISQ